MREVYAYGTSESDPDAYVLAQHYSIAEAARNAEAIYGDACAFVRLATPYEAKLVLDNHRNVQALMGRIGRGSHA